MSYLPVVLLVVVAIFCGLFLLLKVATLVVPLVETRPVRYLVPAPADDTERAKLDPRADTPPAPNADEFNPYEGPSSVDYSTGQVRAAAAAGFTPHGLFVHAKGGTYNVHAVPWLAPDRRTLAVVGWGTLLGINASKTLLYSRLDDGTILLTCDKLPGNDTPGLYEIVVVLNAPFDRLVRRHEQRLGASRAAVVPFRDGDVLAQYEAILARRYEFLVNRKEAYYVDAERSAIRSTVKGAFLLFLRSWKVPGYVERIESPGAGPVPYGRKDPTEPAGLKPARWFFNFLFLFVFFWNYASRPATPQQALFRFAVLSFAFLGGIAVWVVGAVYKRRAARR